MDIGQLQRTIDESHARENQLIKRQQAATSVRSRLWPSRMTAWALNAVAQRAAFSDKFNQNSRLWSVTLSER